MVGIGWSLLNPLAMLFVYTFIFSQVFKARWVGAAAAEGDIQNSEPLSFAVNLFAGLIIFNFLSECVSRAPTLIISNPNYVKKIVFPLEILGAALVGSATFHALISLVVLLLFRWIAYHSVPATFILFPITWLPLVLCCLALSWLLSAAGIFLRDIGQIVNVFLNIILYMSPIFYPISAFPLRWKSILLWNPLTFIIEDSRSILIKGTFPQGSSLLILTVCMIAFTEASFRIFQKSRKHFADVI